MSKEWFPWWLEGGMPEGKGEPPSGRTVYAIVVIVIAVAGVALAVLDAAGVPVLGR